MVMLRLRVTLAAKIDILCMGVKTVMKMVVYAVLAV